MQLVTAQKQWVMNDAIDAYKRCCVALSLLDAADKLGIIASVLQDAS